MQPASHHVSRYFANLRHAIMFQPVWVPVYLQILHLVAACSPRPPAQCPPGGGGAGHRCGFKNLSLSSAVRFPDSSVTRLVPLQRLAAPLPHALPQVSDPEDTPEGPWPRRSPLRATRCSDTRHAWFGRPKKNKNTKSYWTIFNYLWLCFVFCWEEVMRVEEADLICL